MKSAKNTLLFLSILMALLLIFREGTAITEFTSGREVLDKTIESILSIQRMTFKLKKAERLMDGTFMSRTNSVKMQVKPRRIYMKVVEDKIEVLWKEGWNDNQAKVYPGGFPFTNLNLDPNGGLMRKNQHHSLNELGFTYLGQVLKYYRNLKPEEFSKQVKILAPVVWDKRECYNVLLDYPSFAFINYTVQNGENLIKIARKLYINEYMILENNTFISDYDDVKAGDVIRIPNVYCRQMQMYIDKKTFIPVMQKVYDNKGMYEQYEYYNFELNPVFQEVDFSEENPAYKF